ncbi:MAG TPA: hypothetical protein VMZ32_05415 [Gammaproteobacteria bacterium]|nr:hypothetical protein [Gammaproteobacteria bacterium]
MTIRLLPAHFTTGLGTCCLLISGLVHAAVDEALFAAASHEQAALIDILQELVMIESGSHDAAGLAQMAQLLDQRLQALGFATQRHKSAFDVGAEQALLAALRASGSIRRC